MIKGVSKNVVVIKGIKSSYIDEAIFILKPKIYNKSLSKKDILIEVKKIIKQNVK